MPGVSDAAGMSGRKRTPGTGSNTTPGGKRKKAAARPRPRLVEEPPPPPIVALSLAHQMAEAVGAVGGDREDLVLAALRVGEWLAQVGRPGRWDTLEVAHVVNTLPLDARVERGRFLLSLAGLIGFAGLEGHVAPVHARRCLAEIEFLADDHVVADFARLATRQLPRSR